MVDRELVTLDVNDDGSPGLRHSVVDVGKLSDRQLADLSWMLPMLCEELTSFLGRIKMEQLKRPRGFKRFRDYEPVEDRNAEASHGSHDENDGPVL